MEAKRKHDFEGYLLEAGFLSIEQVSEIIAEIEQLPSHHPKHGLRHADKKLAAVAKLIRMPYLQQKAAQFLSPNAQVVRVILFDKNPDKNWLVPWHQDRTIAVSQQHDLTGWKFWSIKDGQHHVQPPRELLDNMVTLRIHLDNTTAENGCLKVIPNSYRNGILSKAEIDEYVANIKAIECIAQAGDLLVMKPLLLHSSSKALKPTHRRVIHIEYSDQTLPLGLNWL